METFSDDLQLLLFPELLDLSLFCFFYLYFFVCFLSSFLFILAPGQTFYTLPKATFINGETPPHSCLVMGFCKGRQAVSSSHLRKYTVHLKAISSSVAQTNRILICLALIQLSSCRAGVFFCIAGTWTWRPCFTSNVSPVLCLMKHYTLSRNSGHVR